MFEFLFQKKDGTIQDILDVITVELNKIQMALLMQEKAQHMIANAISRSPIRMSNKNGFMPPDQLAYRLNIRPNSNQLGADFWYMVMKRVLKEGKALVVSVGGSFYVAENWTEDPYILFEKRYRDVTITDGENSFLLGMSFPARDVMRFVLPDNGRRKVLTESVLKSYNTVLEAVSTMVTVSNSPAFKYKTGANMIFRDKADPKKVVTLDKVMERIKDQLSQPGIKIIQENEGTTLEYLEFKSSVTPEHMQRLKDDMMDLAAAAWDIPKTVFTGTVTEKSDADNEFVTYACNPIVKMANDALTACIIGEQDYIKGERIGFWMTRFKHIDPIEKASNLSQLRGIGFSLDEIFQMVGFPAINTEFSQARALTLNYAAEGQEEGKGDGPADDPADEPRKNATRKQSKHAERRRKREQG